MEIKTYNAEVVVVGGGVSGVVSAIASARNGAKTILIHNRSVLGGNASSEGRVHIGGATEHGVNYDTRESGIIEEIRLETAVYDPYNNYTWIDTALYTKCVEEPNLKVLLNTHIHKVNIKQDDRESNGVKIKNKIMSVEGYVSGSEMKVLVNGDYFIDGTGHGTLGYLAGAEYRYGQEANSEFDESLAPDSPSKNVLGASILFKAEDRGIGPINFEPPSWAIEFSQELLEKSRKNAPGKSDNHKLYWHSDTAGWWWVELGGNPNDYDPIKDNENLRHDLQAICYGIWDYIKNKHPNPNVRKQAENFEISWIGSVPAHRESRRLIGDYILTQNDVESCKLFDDRIACGGWSIDLHPGDFWNPASSSSHTYMEVPYSIPYRCIYSKNIDNLFMGSRCLSVTHVAHGTTRLIATLALCGQAAGTAAALCVKEKLVPRELYKEKIADLQQLLIKQDSMLLGIENNDTKDLALKAKISSNSEYPCKFEDPNVFIPIYFPLTQRFWLPETNNQNGEPEIEFLIENNEDEEVIITGGIRRDDGRLYFTAKNDLNTFTVKIPANGKNWVRASMDNNKNPFIEEGNYWIYLNPPVDSEVSWGMNYYHWPGTRIGYFLEEEQRWQVLRYNKRQFYDGIIGPRGTFCFRIKNVPSPYPASMINNGKHRPFIRPNLWVSAPFREKYIPAFIQVWETQDKGDLNLNLNKTLSIDEALKRVHAPQAGKDYPINFLKIEPSSPIEIYIEFQERKKISEIWFTFDTDLDNSFPHQNYQSMKIKDWPIIGKAPCCISDMEIYSETQDGSHIFLGKITKNYQRFLKWRLNEPIETQKLILMPKSNWGFHTFNLYQIRIY